MQRVYSFLNVTQTTQTRLVDSLEPARSCVLLHLRFPSVTETDALRQLSCEPEQLVNGTLHHDAWRYLL